MALTKTDVSKLYVSIFNRASEAKGNTNWQQFETMTEVANSMLDDKAAKEYFGSSIDSNVAFVEHIYKNTLNKGGTDVDPAGKAGWVKLLETGMSKGEMVSLMIEAIAEYAPGGTKYDATDTVTVAAYNQFTNRVKVSDYTADTLATITVSEIDSTLSFGGALIVTADPATVTTAKAKVDAINPANVGTTFTLTTGVDIFVGTAKNDTFTAAAGTLNNGDVLTDPSTSDNDTLNAVYNASTITAGGKPTISGIENININIDAFAGTATTFNATNVSGSTITLSSTKAGFDGEAGVLAAGANNVTAGTGIKDLTVAGLSTGKVNTGTAKTVEVQVDDTKTLTANLTVNANIDDLQLITVGNTDLKTVNITATEASVLTAGATLFGANMDTTTVINVDGDVTLKGTGAQLSTINVKNVGTGALKAEINGTAAAADLSKAEVSEITLSTTTAYANEVKFLEGATVTATGSLGAATFTNGAEFASQKQGSELTVDLAGATIGAATVKGFETTTINIAQDVAVTSVTATKDGLTGDMSVAFVGEGDVTFTGQTTAAVLDASGINGDLTYATATGNKITVKGGTGANQITAADTAEVTYVGQNGGDTIAAGTTSGILSVETGSGKDTLNITALTTGKILANLGAGDDLVKLTGLTATTTGTLILDGGAGSDTLRIDNTAAANVISKAAAGSSVTGFETLQLLNATGAANKLFTLGAYVLDGASMSVESYTGTTTTPTASNYDILVNEAAATKAVSVDLSGLTFSALKPITALDVTTGTGADTVIGANLSSGMTSKIETGAGNDTVVVGSGAGVTKVNIKAGNNSIDLSSATAANVLHFDSTATGKTTIDGWKAVTKLDFTGLGVTGVAAGVTESVTSADTNELVTDTVYFINTTGKAANFTLEGTSVVTDFTSVNQVSAYLNEHFANTTSSVGDTNVFIFNDTNTGVNKSYIYSFADTATNTGVVDAAELTLVGMVNNAGTALNTSNYVDGAF